MRFPRSCNRFHPFARSGDTPTPASPGFNVSYVVSPPHSPTVVPATLSSPIPSLSIDLRTQTRAPLSTPSLSSAPAHPPPVSALASISPILDTSPTVNPLLTLSPSGTIRLSSPESPSDQSEISSPHSPSLIRLDDMSDGEEGAYFFVAISI